jgi:hypothetical protein
VKLVAEALGQYENPEEGEHPQLEAANREWLVKTGRLKCPNVFYGNL